GTYRKENTRFRDAGRPLTEVRDAEALIETLDQLRDRFPRELSAQTLSKIHKIFKERLRDIRKKKLDEERTFNMLAGVMKKARAQAGDWRIAGNGWSALGSSLKRVHRKGRRALADASADPATEKLHEWRKQAKYLWHQLQILEPSRPKIMDELTGQ